MLAKLVQQFQLKIFFSNKYVHTHVLNKVEPCPSPAGGLPGSLGGVRMIRLPLAQVNAGAAFSVSSSGNVFRDVLGENACRNDLKACLLAGNLLAQRCRQNKARRPRSCSGLRGLTAPA